jgi:succinoglycan biosynthesis protein ExoM
MGYECRVAVGVCTAYRSDMLERCLAALAAQVLPPGAELTIVIADNEAEPNNREAVAKFARTCPFEIRYVHEPRCGISRARNAVLDACGDRFDWIAFTDDDCVPAPDWIAALLAAAARHGADVVYGRREWTPPPQPAPFWFVPHSPCSGTEGGRLDVAATHNVLMAGELASLRCLGRRIGLRFDVRLAHGEDTDFFWRAGTGLGARIVYSAAPVVHEIIPAHRATMRYQMMRRFHRDASRLYFERRYRGFGRAVLKCARRFLWHVPISIVCLMAAPLLALLDLERFKKVVLTNMGRIVGTAGAFAGLAGVNGNPYRNIAAARPRARSHGSAAGSALPRPLPSVMEPSG